MSTRDILEIILFFWLGFFSADLFIRIRKSRKRSNSTTILINALDAKSFAETVRRKRGGEKMSYSRCYLCSNCIKRGEKEGDGKCIDALRIEEAINKIHSTTDGGHQGNGTVTLFCYAHETEKK